MPKKKSRLSYSYKIKQNHNRQILALEKNDEFKSQESARKYIENALSDIKSLHAEVGILKEHLMEVVCQTITTTLDTNRTLVPDNINDYEKFVCSFCKKRFGTSLGLTIHQKQHANDSNEFKCHVCNQLFDNYSLMSTHYFNVHSFETEIQTEEITDEDFERSIRELDYLDSQRCQACLKVKTFPTLKLYRRHVILRHSDNQDLMKYFTFVCLQCNKPYVSRRELESHWNIRCYERWKEGKTEEETNVVCAKCGMKFKSTEKLTSHFQIFHEERVEEKLEKPQIIDTTTKSTIEKPFQCKFCDMSYATEKETTVHQGSVHKKFVCKQCGEICARGKEAKAHRKAHSQYLPSDTPSVCELCGKSFKSYVSLYMHKYYIHRGKIFVCDICGKETNNPFALKTHKLIHDDWKGFGCSVCGKRLRTKQDGFAHRKTHKKEIAQILMFSKESLEVKVVKEPSKKIVNSKPVISVKNIQYLQVEKDTCHNFEISERLTSCFPSLPEEYSNPASPEFQNSPDHDSSVENEYGQNQDAFTTTCTISKPIVNANNSTSSLPPDCSNFFLTDSTQLGGANEFNIKSIFTVEVPRETVPPGEPLNAVEQPTLEDRIDKKIEQQTASFENMTVQSCYSNLFNEESESVQFEDNCWDLEYESKVTLIPLASEGELDIKKVMIKTEESDENTTSLTSKRFPLDPFTPQLILKLQKLKQFNCIPCDKTIVYSNDSEIRSHRRKHRNTIQETNVSEDEDNFNCALCPETFENKKDLSHHKSKHHLKPKKVKNKKKLDGFYRCSQCEATFSWGTHLTDHCLKEHAGIRCFQCEICLIKCFTHKLLNGHKVKVHFKKKAPPPRPAEKEYMCEVCRKAFHTPRLVKMHILFVHQERKFGCDICGKSFKVAKHLKMHKVRHTGIKPFICEHCGCSFYENKELTDHLNSKHYKIDTRKAYKEKLKQIRKMQKITGVKIISTTKKHNFSCNVCQKTFIKESGLTNHLKLHEPDRKYACDICGLRYKFSHNYKLHTELVHKKKSE